MSSSDVPAPKEIWIATGGRRRGFWTAFETSKACGMDMFFGTGAGVGGTKWVETRYVHEDALFAEALKRDVAEVERYLHDCAEGVAHWEESARETPSEWPDVESPEDQRKLDDAIACCLDLAQAWRRHEATCRSWLARAKAALG